MALERIHKVLGNIVRDFNGKETYVDGDDPWLGVLSAAAFSIRSTTNGLKFYILGRLLFGRNMIILIKHNVDW